MNWRKCYNAGTGPRDRDGKGRINCIGKPWSGGWSLAQRAAVAGKEFTVDECDMGEVISDYSWEVRSGKMKDGSQGERRDDVDHKWGKDYWITEGDNGGSSGHGHTPPGWWYVGGRLIVEDKTKLGDGKKTVDGVNGWYQGYYVRWKNDDPNQYSIPFIYQSTVADDREIGPPDVKVGFKANMHIIPGNYNFGRTDIQVHPDGWRNGSSGCVSLQWWKGTKKVDKFLRRFNGLKVRVQTN